jgi:hypothetical protein
MAVLAAALFACTDPVLPPAVGNCAAPVADALTHLGLAGQSITALRETPWGLFAGTDRSGVYRCGPDTGNRWKALGLDHAIVSAILFVPGPTPRILVGMRSRAMEETAAAVFASEDRGQSWLPWDGGLAARNGNRQWAYSLAIDPGNPNRLFMGQSLPILRSLDAGRTWTYTFGAPDIFGQGVDAIAIGPEADGRVYAGVTSAFSTAYVLRSEDWGSTWKALDPMPRFEQAIFSLAVDPSKPGRLWIGMYGGVMRSQDYGDTWQVVLRHPDFIVKSLLLYGNTLYAVGGTIQEPPTLAPPLTVYRTMDGGTNWIALAPLPNPGGSDVATLDSQGRLLIGATSRSRGGVWRLDPTRLVVPGL